ncbi:MAG: tetratricopeptide repeat protein, partial [Alphaproteobacteria bacterium]
MAAAQSSRDEAWQWCARQDASISRETQIAGCSWLIESGQETPQYQAIALNSRGIARAALRDQAGAMNDYSEAIRADPQNTTSFNLRGLLRAGQGDRAGAISDYTEAIRLNPQAAEAFNNRGLARAGEADRVGAIADYTEAIRRNPQFALAFNNRGFA